MPTTRTRVRRAPNTANISLDVLKAFKRGVELRPSYEAGQISEELRDEYMECSQFLALRLGTDLYANVLDVEANEQRPEVGSQYKWYDSIPIAGLLRAKLEKELLDAEKLGKL